MKTYSISLSGLLSLQLHALNNEGNEGNQTLTRRYYIIQKDSNEPKLVNGISGDMLKHIQAEHLQRVAVADALPLSLGARQLNPDRIGYDIDHTAHKLDPFFTNGETGLPDKTATILQRCAVSDLEGFMVTEKKGQTLKRDSVIEFGAVVGIPEQVKTQSYFHAKYGTDNPTPYNVQVSSGLYATVAHLEAFRIGYNPHSFDYSIDTAARKKRLDALLKSLLYTYLQPNGAKRNTHLPHPDAFEGVITLTTERCPAPMVSPLDGAYREQIAQLVTTLNQINGPDSVQQFPFNTLAEFGEAIAQLLAQVEPWEN